MKIYDYAMASILVHLVFVLEYQMWFILARQLQISQVLQSQQQKTKHW